jgi:hypothetical protein
MKFESAKSVIRRMLIFHLASQFSKKFARILEDSVANDQIVSK